MDIQIGGLRPVVRIYAGVDQVVEYIIETAKCGAEAYPFAPDGLPHEESVEAVGILRFQVDVPVNGMRRVMKFGDYLSLIEKGPTDLRIFLFDIFKKIPELADDIRFPTIMSRKSIWGI